MKRAVAEALEASIKHWDENAKAQTPKDASTRARDCALCRMFPGVDASRGCPGCPVHERTGHECGGSPYYDADSALTHWRVFGDGAHRFRAAAIAERDFLISLREPVEDDQ